MVNEVPRGGIALPGLTNKQQGQNSWQPRMEQQIYKWSKTPRDPCERPRTYDKLYQKTPGNYIKSTVSLCGSENEGDDTRIATPISKVKQKLKTRKGESSADSKHLTKHEINNISHHLSMKKTIRKKIMRDLQQAFIGQDTMTETNTDNFNTYRQNDNMQMVQRKSESNILDMLRDSDDSGHFSPSLKHKFRSYRSQDWFQPEIKSTSENKNDGQPQLNHVKILEFNKLPRARSRDNVDMLKVNENVCKEPPPDYNDMSSKISDKKKTFWQRLIRQRSNKEKK